VSWDVDSAVAFFYPRLKWRRDTGRTIGEIGGLRLLVSVALPRHVSDYMV